MYAFDESQLSTLCGYCSEREKLRSGTIVTTGCPAQFDADLQTVIDAWPTLPKSTKSDILATVRAADGAE